MKLILKKFQQGGTVPNLVTSYVPVMPESKSPLAYAQNYPSIGILAGLAGQGQGQTDTSSKT